MLYTSDTRYGTCKFLRYSVVGYIHLYILSFNYMAAGPARFARNPGCRNRAGQAEILYVIASAEHTGLN
jgi:hypothetical protein